MVRRQSDRGGAGWALPLYNVQTLSEHVDATLHSEQFMRSVFTIFAATALVLAAVGVFGVLSNAVSQRRKEIGVRIALGAEGGRMIRLMMGQGMKLVGAGAVLGLGVSVATNRFVQRLVYDTEMQDPIIYGAILAILGTVALLAWIPARRAARIDPIGILRQ